MGEVFHGSSLTSKAINALAVLLGQARPEHFMSLLTRCFLCLTFRWSIEREVQLPGQLGQRCLGEEAAPLIEVAEEHILYLFSTFN